MTALAITYTKVAGVHDTKEGNKSLKIRDVTIDTGTYAAGGNVILARDLDLRRIDFAQIGGNGLTGGTSGATMNPIGVTYASDGASITVQQYESADTGLPLLEKTDTEATVASAAFRLMVIGQ